jgi:hypothetical protein
LPPDVRVDAVEKVLSMPPIRNNRIDETNFWNQAHSMIFLNQCCALDRSKSFFHGDVRVIFDLPLESGHSADRSERSIGYLKGCYGHANSTFGTRSQSRAKKSRHLGTFTDLVRHSDLLGATSARAFYLFICTVDHANS